MKRLLAVVLAALMLVSVLASCNSKAPVTKEPSSSVSPTQSAGEDASTDSSANASADPSADGSTETSSKALEEYVDDYVDDDDRSDIPVVKEHQMLPADKIPESFSLIGTTHLPPIDNQGGLGTCASQAITYTQMTNAVSRYLHSKNENINWDPSSGDTSTIFAPKFTYNFSGAGTAWVYDIIMDHGAALLKDCYFYTTDSGYKTGDSKYNRHPQTIGWQVTEGELEKALNYRISNYEQIWTRTIDNNLTYSEAGADLMYKIKDALVQGNVVVTGGFSYSWKLQQLTAKDVRNTTAKAGEMVCTHAEGLEGGHQVSIVGYDDNITCTLNGATMKGAFLIANSWGENWANNGYFWMMYDAVNAISEFEEINAIEGRNLALDQFCFIYWDKDIVIEKPSAYVTVEVETTDREGFYIELTRTDATDTMATHVPALFQFGANFNGYHGVNPGYLSDTEKYVTFSGQVDGEREKGVFTLGYQPFLSGDTSFEDYLWGVNVVATSATTYVRKITLYDGQGNKKAEIVPEESMQKVLFKTNSSYVFDLGETPKSFHDVGSYKLKNVNTGLYCTSEVLLLNPGESAVDATIFDVEFDLIERHHVIKMHNNKYVLDVKNRSIIEGDIVKFNAVSVKRTTQTWKVVKLDDGSYNVRLAADTRYAMGMKDGKIVLVTGADIKEYGCWIFEKAGSDLMTVTVRADESGKLMVDGRIPTGVEEDTLKIDVTTADGKAVTVYDVTGKGEMRSFAFEATGLEKGKTYVFTLKNSKGAPVTCSYVVCA